MNDINNNWNLDNTSIENESDDDDDSETESKIYFNLTSTPNDFNISTLISFIDRGVFKIPSFQRNYIWSKEKASKLIESLIIGLPIPQIFLYEKQRNIFSIIDGQQRLLSLYFFYKGRFPKNDAARALLRKESISEPNSFIKKSVLDDDNFFINFNLSLVDKSKINNNMLHGFNFNTLDIEPRTKLELATIRNMVIKPEVYSEDNVHQAMFEIFNRLNSGGMNLNNQEIRMSLYACKFMDSLFDLNKNDNWRTLLGSNDVDIRLKDCEQILRLIAILIAGTDINPTRFTTEKNQYKGSLSIFLNRFANYSKSLTEEDIALIEDIWNDFMSKITNISISNLSNSNSNDSSSKISMPVLEAIFFACCKDKLDKHSQDILSITNEMIQDLKNQTSFLEYAVGKTSSKKNINHRLDIAYDFFRKYNEI